MSFKAKNLTVNSEEPAFLKRLRGEVGGEGQRHTNPIARPKKDLLRDDGEDDAPTYVDAETNDTLSKDEFEKLQGGPHQDDDPPANSSVSLDIENTNAATDAKSATKKEQVGQIGGASKRRVAKVIGDGDEVEEKGKAEEKPKKRKKNDNKKTKIKLSFEDE